MNYHSLNYSTDFLSPARSIDQPSTISEKLPKNNAIINQKVDIFIQTAEETLDVVNNSYYDLVRTAYEDSRPASTFCPNSTSRDVERRRLGIYYSPDFDLDDHDVCAFCSSLEKFQSD